MQIQKAKQGYNLVKSLFGKYLEIPNDWSVNTVDDLGEIKGRVGWRGYTQNDFVEKGKGSISLGANSITKNNQLDFRDLTYVTWQKYEESPEIQVSNGDIIIAQRGSIGKVALIHNLPEKSTINPNVVLLKNIKSNNLFLFYFLTSFYIQKQMSSITSSTTIPLLTQSQIKSFKVLTPPILEQQKIASILSNIDSLIQKTQRAVEQTQRLNKGLTQKLLTKGIGHTKFKKTKFLFGKIEEFPENWDVLRFDEFISFKSGSTPRRENPEYFQGKIPWVTSTDLKRGMIVNTLEKITEEAVQKTRLKIFPKGTFVIALYGLEAAGTRGKCGILGIDATINQACMVLNPSEKVDSKYLFYYYLNFGERIVFNVAQGTKQQNLSEDVLKSIKMPIPPITEQKIITQILANADLTIQKQQQYKSNLEKLKKGLMQKILTGQIRVKI